ncbi:amylo-alpha-1,6-glucosidase [Georgenia thermotolerans]|uniref:Amylo-alpha-1,6-glucosidase n=1 Tax=Georgenia thermotolerans TaxID=527326 RepID=A0A7J5UNE4_9MICO|nr:glycogen debranching N-terminal domain-containing protein [Georgenia thermotolerans]KAE8763905.1 amylo-alpha-1,6-glucosidase [Georgenia thermotolerans]
MTQAWNFAGAPSGVTAGAVTLIEGSSFCISDAAGDISPGGVQGLFVRDTRVLSRWELRVDGEPVEPLTVFAEETYQATYVGRARPRAGLADSTLLVERHRFVSAGMREDLVVRNLGRETAAFAMTVHVGADFGDLFEVKQGNVTSRGDHRISFDEHELRLARRWQGHTREVVVSASDARVAADTLTFRVVVPPRGIWRTSVYLNPVDDGEVTPIAFPADQPMEVTGPQVRRSAWRHETPSLSLPDPVLTDVLRTSSRDLESLRIDDPAHPDSVAVAAGAPWFMALFGRDSILTAMMTLAINPSLALGTAEALARHQGTKVDAVTEEQPGRIPHELRFGVDAEDALGGNVYYGTADATPLFVMLVGDLARWGADPARVRALLPHVDRALEWIETYGDADGDGFVEYQRTTDRGLVNQGWKDSFDGITDASGRIPEGPIALVEVQAYVYGAYLARALLAEALERDADAAARYRERAARLRERFEAAFWLPERGWYALGLDGAKRPVDSLASNMGHALWTGIVPPERARQVADHLLSPEMFSGWGVRTLATTMGAYNPMSYHNGSVWPHDNAIIAAGLRRYGLVEHATAVARAVLDTAAELGGRLPELLCGFDRAEYPRPVPYPAACSPQAWASAAPLELMRVMLGVEPCLPHHRLALDPVLPAAVQPLSLRGIPFAGGEVDLAVRDDVATVTGLPDGLTVGPGTCPCHGDTGADAGPPDGARQAAAPA